jgi:hypothetical protein
MFDLVIPQHVSNYISVKKEQGKRSKWKLPTPVSRLHGPLQEQEHPTQTIQELLELLLKVQCKVSRPEK